MKRPTLTFPPDVAERVRQEYSLASIILEYGSGGSTVVASEHCKGSVYSVESDPAFLCRLNTYLSAAGTTSDVITYYSDIGPVGKWGRPKDDAFWRLYPGYAMDIWKQEWFQNPELILIDGRFRVACFVASCVMTARPVKILFDDFVGRKKYHVVKEFADPVEIVDRMAIFQVNPGSMCSRKVLEMSRYLYNPE